MPVDSDSEAELEQVLVEVVSSSHESLNQIQNQTPIQQQHVLVSNGLQQDLDQSVSSDQKAQSLSHQLHPPEPLLEEVTDSGEHLKTPSQQNNSVTKSAAKKAAKLAAKLKSQEALDPSTLSERKLQMGGSSKAGQKGKQKGYTKGSHKSGK